MTRKKTVSPPRAYRGRFWVYECPEVTKEPPPDAVYGELEAIVTRADGSVIYRRRGDDENYNVFVGDTYV